MHLTVFTLARMFLYTVDTVGGDGTANFTELGSDYSEPGKHVWTFDMMSVFGMFALSSFMACLWASRWISYYMQSWGKWVSKIHKLLDMSLHGHVMAWEWVRWQCCSMPVLCQTIWLQCQHESVQFPSVFPSCTTTCFPQGIWLSKLQTAFLVHTKRRGRDDGSMALD